MPYYIIKTTKGYYNGFDKTGRFPVYSPEVTHEVYVCGENEKEATDDFDFHRGLITEVDGLETMPKLMAIKSKPAPPEDPVLILKYKVLAPPPGWRVLDSFGYYLALLTNGTSFAVRTEKGIDAYAAAKEAAIHWCVIRENVLKIRVDKLAGGDGGA